jgi:hypothetical protein
MVLENGYCEYCNKIYTDIIHKWCKPCLMKQNCISGNDKIDDFIQEMRLKINQYYDIIIEWIPYKQLSNIKEIGKDDFTIIYSAI